MSSRHWPAPAKLNLMLHINAQRKDGYHLIQTVFQLLDYSDFLDFNITKDSVVVCHSNDIDIAAADNLVTRAALALQQEANCRLGATIRLRKKLPIGGGLGGGSSDAATTLVALNHLWQINFPLTRLATIGLRLGADLPLFIFGRSAWAEGIGEDLTAIELLPAWYLVVQPDCHISTGEIFGSADLQCNTPAIRIDDFLTQQVSGNDCQEVVKALYPEVAEALGWLGQFAVARLTGTGACIFAHFDQQQPAESVYRQLPQRWQGFVAEGVNYSPLLVRLQQERSYQRLPNMAMGLHRSVA